MKVTYGDDINKKQLKLDDVLVLKAANGEGEVLISELHNFGNKQSCVVLTSLQWVEKQKAWFDLVKNKVLLFNVAETDEDQAKAVAFIAEYLEQKKGKPVRSAGNVVEGVLTTDLDTPLITDNSKALQVHKPSEKNKVDK